MKYLQLLICVGVLSGCTTLNSLRQSIFGADDISGEDKIEYAKVVEEKEAQIRQYREANRAFMPYHYAAIGMILSGVGMIVLNKTRSDIGFGTILGGVGLSAWAMVAPNNLILVTILLTAGLVASVVYIGYRQLRKA